jgi:septal ring factor EnvC (AmiA/AmiB activator)
MTVYANLATVSVSVGQKIKAGQSIGTVYSDPNDNGRSVLHFEIRNGKQKENPEAWLRR